MKRLSVNLKSLSFIIERFVPRVIHSFLEKKLQLCKDKGTITDYALKVNRIQKYHYTVEIDVFFKTEKGGEASE